MDPTPTPSGPFSFSDPRELRIFEGLRRMGEGPAIAFKDACQLMARPLRLETTSHLVAHLLRDIDSAIRELLQPITGHAKRAGSKGPKKSDCTENNHEQTVRACLASLEIPDEDPVAQAWLDVAKRGDEGFAGRAHRRGLSRPRPIDESFLSFWSGYQAVLERICDRFDTLSVRYLRVIDTLIQRTAPTKADAEKLRASFPNNGFFLHYLFNKPPTREWLEPLRDAGFFDDVPEPVPTPDGRGTRYPSWPAGKYLIRMASIPDAQNVVSGVIAALPPTENFYVATDIAEAVLALPPELAAQHVSKVRSLIGESCFLLLAEKVAELVVALARAGKVEDAIGLCGDVLGVRDVDQRLDRINARCEPYEYARVLEKVVPALEAAAPEQAFALFAGLLIAAMGPRASDDREADDEDGSSGWRPAIEDHEQNWHDEIRDGLVVAVRTIAERIAAGSEKAASHVVALLEQRGSLVFRRIAIHVLATCPFPPMKLVAERLASADNFDALGLHHEYFNLLKARFSDLEPEQQARVLKMIEAGPDMAEWRDGLARWQGHPPTPEEEAAHVELWTLKQLSPIAHALQPPWKERYEDLLKRHGAPEHADLHMHHSGVWVGPQSPLSGEDLAKKSVSEITSFLRTWKPPGQMMDVSPDGLARELAKTVGTDPARFAEDALAFKGLDPTYVRGLLDGFRDATANNRPFSWKPVLELADWVIDQADDHVKTPAYRFERDADWRGARKAVTDILDNGLAVGPCELPADLGSLAWPLLSKLTTDPDPGPEREKDDEGSSLGPSSLSINSVRGRALHAVVKFGLWRRRQIEKSPDAKDRVARGFDEMPEVREVLDRHLDPAQESSPAVRSVYGQWLPYLSLLDSSWTTSAIPRIFPENGALAPLRRGAWHGYIKYAPFITPCARLLLSQYRHAVEQLTKAPSQESGRREDAANRLAEHLMILQWQGVLDSTDDSSILAKFFKLAPKPVRSHAIYFVGTTLHDTKEPIPPEVIDRVVGLWEWRVAQLRAKAKLDDADRAEFEAFGGWFASGKLEEKWALANLTAALEVAGNTEPDHLVVEKLAEIAGRLPLEALQCLRLLVDGDREGWHVIGWTDDARKLIIAARDSGVVGAQKASEEMISRLVARGHTAFRDLLPLDRKNEAAGAS